MSGGIPVTWSWDGAAGVTFGKDTSLLNLFTIPGFHMKIHGCQILISSTRPPHPSHVHIQNKGQVSYLGRWETVSHSEKSSQLKILLICNQLTRKGSGM